MSKSTRDELKEVCLKIVGHWYCDQLKQHFIFDFNDQLLKMAKMTVINETSNFDTEYGVAIKINPDPLDTKTHFYFDVGKYDKTYYQILNLTSDMLVLSRFQMKVGTELETPYIYIKQKDLSAADDILKGLSST
jgi:hypothetical protein